MNLFSVTILLYIDRGEELEGKLLIKQAKNGDKEALLKLVIAQKTDYYKLAYVYMKMERTFKNNALAWVQVRKVVDLGYPMMHYLLMRRILK